MADAVKEMVIRIKREVDPAGEAASKAAHAAERKQIAETVAAARAARKAEAEAAKQAAKAAADAAKQAANAEKQAAKERVESQKKSAKDILASVKQQVEESKKLEREAFAEGARLAADKAAREKQYTRDAIALARQNAAERKRQLDAQTKATDEAADATRQMTRTLLGTQVAGAALNGIKTAMQAIGQSAVDAKGRIRSLIDEAEAARHADREIAALTGNKATVKFSAAQAGEAAAAGVSPETFRGAQLAFQAQAGQYIGDGEDAKLSQAEASDLMRKVVSFSASQGIAPEDPAKLMGTIISKGDKGESNESRLATFAKLFKAIQLAPGETSPLVGQLAELIQEEVGQGGTFGSVLDAAPLIRAMAERNPGEASTYGRSLIRGLREANMDPDKMAELGLTKGMSFMEQVGAVDRSAAAVGAAGGDEGQFLSKFFKDIREFGAVRTALNAGVRGKGFERVRAEMAGVDADTVGADIQGYLGGEEGQAEAAKSRETQAKLERAAGFTLLQDARRRARTSLEASGDLNRGEGLYGSIMTGLSGWWQGDRAEQESTALVGAELAQRLGGTKAGSQWMLQQGVAPGQSPMSFGQRGATESSLAEGFQVLAKLREAAESLKKAGDAIQGAKPPVPPAAPGRPAGFQARP